MIWPAVITIQLDWRVSYFWLSICKTLCCETSRCMIFASWYCWYLWLWCNINLPASTFSFHQSDCVSSVDFYGVHASFMQLCEWQNKQTMWQSSLSSCLRFTFEMPLVWICVWTEAMACVYLGKSSTVHSLAVGISSKKKFCLQNKKILVSE